ncbi:MAG: chaperone modulator CbpM [marine benthic group bacterium]|nr:chaperone modulator CbpM [Gemmatimonadota bacterium]
MNDSTAAVAHTITVTELAYCAGCSRATILELLDHDLLAPVESAAEPRFAPESVERVRRIHRISIELEVGYPAMGLVLRLLDRIEELERRLRGSG